MQSHERLLVVIIVVIIIIIFIIIWPATDSTSDSDCMETRLREPVLVN